MQAVSVRQPWAFAIARGHKEVLNHELPTTHRGPLLVHASMRVDLDACESPLIRDADWNPRDPLATLGAIIAVAWLETVCSDTIQGGHCACGPWADPGAYHWRLADIRALPRPIVALGRTELWEPTPTLVAEVRAVLPATELDRPIG